MIKIINENCIKSLAGMPDNSIDSIVTDPPYELGFMGKHWDNTGIAYNVELWKECLRVLKPGGYLLSFGGTRTYHRMACAIEDAGFEIRDQIQWLYGSGFPKSLNIGKSIDSMQNNERITVGGRHRNVKPYDDDNGWNQNNTTGDYVYTKGDSEWEGWGTALKPANEPICMARKPLSEKTVAENVLKWGTGGINIDGCRVEVNPNIDDMNRTVVRKQRESETWENGSGFKNENNPRTGVLPEGRFPANVIHDGSDEVLNRFPDAKGQCGDLIGHNYEITSPNGIYGTMPPRYDALKCEDDNKSASRFFYCAKASKSERNKGLDDFEKKEGGMRSNTSGQHITRRDGGVPQPTANNHPTVKPISLMRYLCRLVTPPKGIVLDLFCGSGSTGIGAKLEGFSFIGIEKEKDYCDIAEARIESWEEEIPAKDELQLKLFS